jgi:thiamine biosynthesis lipoprotein ApbE
MGATTNNPDESLHQYTFRAMNAIMDITLFCKNEDALSLETLAKDWFRSVEERFSRFKPDSELSHLNNITEETLPWTVGIEKLWSVQEDIGQINLANGSVATSSKLGRHWETSQGTMHHLINPRTMSPTTNEVVQCTVAGSSVVACEIWAKVICIVGCPAGLTMLAAKTDSYEALVFTDKQETHFTEKNHPSASNG